MDNIFNVQQKLTLDDYLHFDVNQRVNMGETLPIAVYRLLEYSLKEELEDRLGKETQKEIFRAAGFRAGTYFASHMIDLNQDFNKFVADLQAKLAELRIGIIRIESFDQETGKLVLTVSEDADCSGLPLLGETVCHYDEGFIGGVLSAFTHTPYVAIEVDCWATGDRVCRFEANPK